MRMESRDLRIMRRAAVAALAFAASLEAADPKAEAEKNGWSPAWLREAARDLHHLADMVRTADDIMER